MLLEEVASGFSPGSRISTVGLGWNQPAFHRRSPVANMQKVDSMAVLGICSNKYALHTYDVLQHRFSNLNVHMNPLEVLWKCTF